MSSSSALSGAGVGAGAVAETTAVAGAGPVAGVDPVELVRSIVAIPSLSGDESAVMDHVAGVLTADGVCVERLGRNLVARTGTPGGPRLLLNSHLDTVPPAAGWTLDPYAATDVDDRIHGLGSNDAGASAMAMLAAFVDAHHAGAATTSDLMLTLVVDEETGGEGTEVVWPALRERGWVPDGVVVGEPTGLQVAIAQKGMLILELETSGDACHSANALALGARNAALELARDLVRLADVDLGPVHPELGPSTLQPTIVEAGTARNMVPGRATAALDLRTVPGLGHEAIIDRVRAAASGTVKVISQRLEPRHCVPDAPVVRAALAAAPGTATFSSATMSDLVFFDGVDAIKCGPGDSARSHRPDEYILPAEIRAGHAFYRALINGFPDALRATP